MTPSPPSPTQTASNLQVVYCTYRSADLSTREQLAFGSDESVAAAHEEMRSRFPGAEHVVISTCNRVELYLASAPGQSQPSRKDIASFLSEFHGIQAESFLDDLLRAEGPQAARHLFEVAASIDSMVVGENQIVQQVKRAYDLATQSDASGPIMHTLFQRALKVASRVRSETSLGSGRLSVASVAVGEFARQIFSGFAGRRVLVVGAGEMARETVQYLKADGASDVVVLNRNIDRAKGLAAEIDGQAVGWEELPTQLASADIVISATGASQPVITRELFDSSRRVAKTILLLDLGAPRDIEASIGDAGDEVYLYNVDDLQATCDANRQRRSGEIAKAGKIIDQETAQFIKDIQHRATGPIIRELRESWKLVCDEEVAQLFKRLPDLGDADRKQVERTIHRIVNKLLHPPLEAIREDSAVGHQEGLLDAVQKLFGLKS